MAIFKKKQDRGPRVFIVVRGDERAGIKSAYLTFDDANGDQRAEHVRRLIEAQSSNKGAFLDAPHRLKKAEVEADFVRERIISAHGFEVEDENGKRELTWSANAEEILELLEDGQLTLLKETVDQLNFPSSFARLENAAANGRRELPNF